MISCFLLHLTTNKCRPAWQQHQPVEKLLMFVPDPTYHAYAYSTAPLVVKNTGSLEVTWDAARLGFSLITKTFPLFAGQKHLQWKLHWEKISERKSAWLPAVNSKVLSLSCCETDRKNADLNGLLVSASFTRSLLGILDNRMHFGCRAKVGECNSVSEH